MKYEIKNLNRNEMQLKTWKNESKLKMLIGKLTKFHIIIPIYIY